MVNALLFSHIVAIIDIEYVNFVTISNLCIVTNDIFRLVFLQIYGAKRPFETKDILKNNCNSSIISYNRLKSNRPSERSCVKDND